MTVATSAWHTASATPAAATAHGDDQSSHHHCTPMVTTPGGHPIARLPRRSLGIAPYTAGRISRERFAAEVKCPKQVSGGVWIV